MVHISESGRTQVASLHPQDSRRDHSRQIHSRAVLTVLDGEHKGGQYDVTTREGSGSEITFLLRESLSVGQTCRIELPNRAGLVSYLCEVVRSRPISNGRHEMALQFRKAA